MTNPLSSDTVYKDWLKEIKYKIQTAQIKAALLVNRELLLFYWELGGEIIEKQALTNWGEKFLAQLSNDLIAEFPGMKGFSERNLKYIRQWRTFYHTYVNKKDDQIGQQLVAQLTTIPWGHNIAIISKCSDIDEAMFYIKKTSVHNWSRNVLVHQIESGLYQREGKALTNFSSTLPKPQSDLANQTLKDPYIFDFLSLTPEYTERDLENNLIKHITHFLLELGSGFAFIGKQVPLQVGDKDFFIDLLFYHTKLHCYIVIELKTGDFEPEHAGKLNFYIKAIDEKLRKMGDEPSIGIILCKKKDQLVVEYTLSDMHKPIGVSEYKLTRALPATLRSSLPSIEEIEAELSRDFFENSEDRDSK